MAGVSLLVKIQANERCLSVPGTRMIICSRGLLTPDHRLPTSTPVVVHLCHGRHELTLVGIVRTSSADSGLAIEFEGTTENMARRLVALLVAQQG